MILLGMFLTLLIFAIIFSGLVWLFMKVFAVGLTVGFAVLVVGLFLFLSIFLIIIIF